MSIFQEIKLTYIIAFKKPTNTHYYNLKTHTAKHNMFKSH